VPPAKTLETDGYARIFLEHDEPKKASGTITNGEHYLQIEILTWSAQKELADKLQKSWSKSGYLWTTPILSLPMKFNVNKPLEVKSCQ
jgi:hypothetical protein